MCVAKLKQTKTFKKSNISKTYRIIIILNVVTVVPASANILSPFFASSIGSTNEVVAVWKQNPQE